MRRLNCQSGSTLVESCFSISAVALLFIGTLTMAYLCLAKVWSGNRVYEAMICVAQKNPQWVCEQNLRASLQNVLSLSQIQDLSFSSAPDAVRIRVKLQVLRKIAMVEEQSLKLPLGRAL